MDTVNIIFFISLIITFVVSVILAIYENAYKTPKFEKSLNVTLVLAVSTLFVSSVIAIHYV
jgi:p-aminobenzoyl-glutamate transporter AbgT